MLKIFYGGVKVRGALETLVSALSPIELAGNNFKLIVLEVISFGLSVYNLFLCVFSVRGGFLCPILYIAVVDSSSYKFSKSVRPMPCVFDTLHPA